MELLRASTDDKNYVDKLEAAVNTAESLIRSKPDDLGNEHNKSNIFR